MTEHTRDMYRAYITMQEMLHPPRGSDGHAFISALIEGMRGEPLRADPCPLCNELVRWTDDWYETETCVTHTACVRDLVRRAREGL